jgi:hypothetical protein
MGTSTIEPVLFTISPSWISLRVTKLAVMVAVFHLPIVAQDDNTDVVRLQVERHTLYTRLELHHLTCLHLGETENSGDTITDGDDRTELLQVVLSKKRTLVAANTPSGRC